MSSVLEHPSRDRNTYWVVNKCLSTDDVVSFTDIHIHVMEANPIKETSSAVLEFVIVENVERLNLRSRVFGYDEPFRISHIDVIISAVTLFCARIRDH